MNGHGGNIASLDAAFSEIYAETSLGTAGVNRPAVRCKIENWWNGDAIKGISQKYFADSEGSHATASEVALTYYGFPDDAARIKQEKLSPRIAPEGAIYDADDYRRRFPDGRIGSDPTLATAEIGQKLFEASVAGISNKYQEFISAI